MNSRFETSKRRLNYLTFDDFWKCASSMMSYWTYAAIGQSVSTRHSESLDDCDLERDFLVQLRDLKAIIEREKEHRNVTLSHLRGKVPDRMCSEVESNFKSYSRTLINIATNLINSKCQREFFLDLVERFIDPCKQARWKPDELECFLKVYADSGLALDLMSSDKVLKSTWQRYMNVMQICIKQLYHS